jgi:hypothetical protein
MRGFIDDKNSTVNRFEDTNQSHTEIMPLVQHDAQLWNDLLDRSGGALEASKCVFAEYGFTPAGKPFYKHFQQNPPSIQIQTNDQAHTTKIPVSLCHQKNTGMLQVAFGRASYSITSHLQKRPGEISQGACKQTHTCQHQQTLSRSLLS